MALAIVWRNPTPPVSTEPIVERLEFDWSCTVYAAFYPGRTQLFTSLPGVLESEKVSESPTSCPDRPIANLELPTSSKVTKMPCPEWAYAAREALTSEASSFPSGSAGK